MKLHQSSCMRYTQSSSDATVLSQLEIFSTFGDDHNVLIWNLTTQWLCSFPLPFCLKEKQAEVRQPSPFFYRELCAERLIFHLTEDVNRKRLFRSQNALRVNIQSWCHCVINKIRSQCKLITVICHTSNFVL